MKILVIGGGGREHALVWKISQSPLVDEIYCIPGNAGIARIARCEAMGATEIENLADFARNKGIDLTVVGPELPLTLGIVDYFKSAGLKIYGPGKTASQLEGSKSFAKNLMKKYRIPTGEYQTFTSPSQAKAYLNKVSFPCVIKADGLAAGKGVIIVFDDGEASSAIDLIMEKKSFGEAGDQIVIEEYLEGEEASFLAFTDGETVLPLPTSQDHKPVYDGDTGPNTGGMGAYSPAPVISDALHKRIMEEIMIPTVQAMGAEGKNYQGILYAGLMIKNDQARVLEFNVRLGDPETQALLMRIKSDLVPILLAASEKRLSQIKIELDKRASVCVVMASQGYPGKYEKGKEIQGLKEVEDLSEVEVFHAGTAAKEGKTITSGGRVLGVTALGEGIDAAINQAYQVVAKISWEGAYFRRDIGKKALDLHEK